MSRSKSAAVCLLLVLSLPTAFGRQAAGLDPTLFSALKWRSIGPVNTAGRIADIAVAHVDGQPETIYVGTASGGIFKSTNAGTSWAPVFDTADAMMSIGALAVAASQPSTVWAGTGEANNRQSSSWGDGVYKSTDAGSTWKYVGLKESRHIARIVVHPSNPDIAYVAAVGHLWGSNPDRGVFKTTDGGGTWTKVLYVDDRTGANDLVIDPQHPETLYASTYQRQRKSWGFNGGGPGSAIYKSIDAGEHWTKLTQGLPSGDKGRIGLAIFDSALLYAIVEAGAVSSADADTRRVGSPGLATASGLYRSTNGGASWEHLSSLNVRPSYYSQIRVDPGDRNRVYELGSNRGFYVSSDGGRTFVDTGVTGVHGEDHALWIDPGDSNHLIVGGDGGLSISRDRGRAWDFRMNMPIGQFYEIDADMRIPYTVCGGLQDNGEWCVPSAVRDRNGISAADAWNVGGGDGFYVKFDPTDWNIVYAESQDGNMARVNLTTLERHSMRPGGTYRWNWDTPIVVSGVDPNVIYTGANVLFRSPDRGATWTAISPDLTLHIDPESLEIMGRPNPRAALSRNDGTSPLGSLTSISESPFSSSVIYTGAQDGTVQATTDGGRTWTNLTPRFTGLPRFTYVSSVLASRHAAGRVYATFDGHYDDDYRPYVFVSDDFGRTWRPLSDGLPETSINRIREHPTNPHLLLLGHARGVHFSNDSGRTWTPLSHVTNLPNVPTDDIFIHPRDNAVILGTHGRGIWILDDAAPLELLTAGARRTDAALAPIAPAREMILHLPQAWFGQGVFFAPNPSFDAGISYYLRDSADRPVEIQIANGAGQIVRTLSGPSARGLNRVAWDLRTDDATRLGARGGAAGQLVPPGQYQVIVKVPGLDRDLRGNATVEADPIATAKR
jgi:photosystem II stability/assembly factor-like uncharacterized protein